MPGFSGGDEDSGGDFVLDWVLVMVCGGGAVGACLEGAGGAGRGLAATSVMAGFFWLTRMLLSRGSSWRKGWAKGVLSLVWLVGVMGSVGSLAVSVPSSSSLMGDWYSTRRESLRSSRLGSWGSPLEGAASVGAFAAATAGMAIV